MESENCGSAVCPDVRCAAVVTRKQARERVEGKEADTTSTESGGVRNPPNESGGAGDPPVHRGAAEDPPTPSGGAGDPHFQSGGARDPPVRSGEARDPLNESGGLETRPFNLVRLQVLPLKWHHQMKSHHQ